MLLSVDRSESEPSQSVSFQVITAVAEREGVDPTDIEPPTYEALYDVINPEALDSLFAPREDGTPRASGTVEFDFCGYRITAHSDGSVELTDESTIVE